MLAYWPDRKLVRDPAFEIRIFFRKIWIYAIPLVRLPTTRIRLAHGVPEVPASHAEPVLASRRHGARGGSSRAWPSQRGDRSPARGWPSHGRRASLLGTRSASATWRVQALRARGAGWLGRDTFPGLRQVIENKTKPNSESPANPPPSAGARAMPADRLVYPQGVAAPVTSVLFHFAVRRKSARPADARAGKFSNPLPTEEAPVS